MNNLRLKLSDQQKQKLARSLTENPEAQKAFLNGLYLYNQGTQQSQKVQIALTARKPFGEKSIEQFQAAIRLEPSYAQDFFYRESKFCLLSANCAMTRAMTI